MNKVFMALLFLTFLGAGVLFWLMKTYPVDGISLGDNAKEEKAAAPTEGATDEHGKPKEAHEEKTAEHGADTHGGEAHEPEAHADSHEAAPVETAEKNT